MIALMLAISTATAGISKASSVLNNDDGRANTKQRPRVTSSPERKDTTRARRDKEVPTSLPPCRGTDAEAEPEPDAE